MHYKKLLIIQPLLASYRKDLFEDMTTYFDKVIIFADLKPKNGFYSPENTKFEKIHTPILGKREKFYFQKNIISYILKNKPAVIFITHDFRSISFWIIIHLAKILNIPIYGHGQGLYDKPKPSNIHKLLFKYSINLLTKYICYAPISYESLKNITIKDEKLEIMENTIINGFPVSPKEKIEINTKKLFYLGRLREGSNLELIIHALYELKKLGYELSLEVIGDGNEKEKLEKLVKELDVDVLFHGKIYDNKQISEISKDCSFGIYPGDAGLSVVHYMSLSLIPIIHNDLSKHMGPEPSYIKDGINGLTFERNSLNSLINILISSINNVELQKKLSEEAYESYLELSKIKMSKKLINIFNNVREI